MISEERGALLLQFGWKKAEQSFSRELEVIPYPVGGRVKNTGLSPISGYQYQGHALGP